MMAGTGTVTGAVYNDLNANGHLDPGEPGLSGWVVYVDTNRNHALDATELRATSDSAGNYALTYHYPLLFVGPKYVREVYQSGWEKTEPSFAQYGIVAGNYSGRNFGNRYVGPPAPAAVPLTPGTHATRFDEHFFAGEPITP